MTLAELFEPDLDYPPDTPGGTSEVPSQAQKDALAALWDVLKTASTHVEVYARCFEYIRRNELIDYSDQIANVTVRKKRFVEIVLEDPVIREEVKQHKLRYLEAYRTARGLGPPGPFDDLDALNAALANERVGALQHVQDVVRVKLEVPPPESLSPQLAKELAEWLAGRRSQGDHLWFAVGGMDVATPVSDRKELFRLLQRYSFPATYWDDPSGDVLRQEIQTAGLGGHVTGRVMDWESLGGARLRATLLADVLMRFEAMVDDDIRLLEILLGHSSVMGNAYQTVLGPAWWAWTRAISQKYHLVYVDLARALSFEQLKGERIETISRALLAQAAELLPLLALRLTGELRKQFQFDRLRLKVLEVHEAPAREVKWPLKAMSYYPRPIFIGGAEPEFCWMWRNELGQQYKITDPSTRYVYLETAGDVDFVWVDNEKETWVAKIDLRRRRLVDTTQTDPVKQRAELRTVIQKATSAVEEGNEFAKLFNFKRRWECFYPFGTKDNEFAVAFNLCSVTSGYRFSDIGRADDVPVDEFRWTWMEGRFSEALGSGDKDVALGETLGRLIGLDGDGYLTPEEVASQTFHALPESGDVAREYIGARNRTTGEVARYVRVNLPHNLTGYTKTGLHGGYGVIYDAFRFRYYRKVRDHRVVKSSRKNEPRDEPPSEPFSFAIPLNHDRLHMRDKARRKALKQKKYKEHELRRPPMDIRKPAGSVMKAFLQKHFPDEIIANGSATQLVAHYLERNEEAQAVWRIVKAHDYRDLPTDQEWCHLHGNSWGGPSEPENFVSGSKHCNTEQLAAESGQALGLSDDSPPHELRTTAYLFEEPRVSIKRKRSGVSTTQSKRRKTLVPTGERQEDERDLQERVEKLIRHESPVMPIAAFMRYKILKRSDGPLPVKVFDYSFEGQSEFFDQNQFRIIQHLVRFLLQGEDKFVAWFRDKVVEMAEELEDE